MVFHVVVQLSNSMGGFYYCIAVLRFGYCVCSATKGVHHRNDRTMSVLFRFELYVLCHVGCFLRVVYLIRWPRGLKK